MQKGYSHALHTYIYIEYARHGEIQGCSLALGTFGTWHLALGTFGTWHFWHLALGTWHFWHPKYPKYAKRLQKVCKIYSKSMQNVCKMYANSMQKICKNDAKSIQNLCKKDTVMHCTLIYT